MGAEIFDVEINLDGVLILYATKVSTTKNRDSNTTLTFQGDVTTSAKNTGGTISIEGLYFPVDIEQAILLENKLNDDNIRVITCSGVSYTANGDPYKRIIIGSGVSVTNDEDEWSPTDGVSQTLELAVNKLTRQAERV